MKYYSAEVFSLLFYIFMIVVLGSIKTSAAPRYKLPLDPEALYATFNNMYFDGSLPKNVAVVDHTTDQSFAGQPLEGETDHTLGTHWYKIYISPQYNTLADQEELSLFHEMCHVSIWEQRENEGKNYVDDHGPAWQGCMLGLAKRGAFHDIW